MESSEAREYPHVLAMPRLNWKRGVLLLAAVGGLLYVSATAARIVSRKQYVFIADYLRWTLTPAPETRGPVHVLLLFADHFEPSRQLTTTRDWLERYESVVARHRDAYGRPPQHTWFYPAEQYEPAILSALGTAVRSGFGEVEYHFHHDFDTAESLRPRLQAGLDRFAEFGFNRTIDGRTRFAFAHGNFGLDNSNGPFYCGVSNELSLLRDLGAFADFTFPSIYMSSQPPVVNRIFAARDDARPKSYDRPLPLSALHTGEADLMIFEGPLVFAPTLNPRRLFLELDDADIHQGMPAADNRINRWLRANVHVEGRPEWVFIKLFAHGAGSPEDIEAVTGPEFDQMLTAFEQQYNDGKRYVLHYVTAREAYNVAMAAADGRSGDPSDYLDYIVPPYVADPPRSH
jgi:hypothetical protein